MSEEDGSDQTGTPWWVKAFITFGLAPAGLAYVIWWVLNVQAVEMRDTKAASQHVLQVLERHNVDTGQLIMQMDRQDSLLRLICWNSGKTTADRNACYER